MYSYSVFNEHPSLLLLSRVVVRLYNYSISLSSLCKDRQPFGYLVMGSSGLEPPTSRLSGARSNLLSYEPVLKSLVIFPNRVWRWWDSNPWPPACRAGALPTELHPRLRALSLPLQQNSLKIEQQTETLLYIRSPYVWRFSLERRWSSRTFRYGYLVTT